jgi:Fic family protein
VIYQYQLTGWPEYHWDDAALSRQLAAVRHRQGRLIGRMEALGFDLRGEAILRTLTQDVVKTSEIEGENLDADQVRSSIARHLGMDIGGLVPSDRDVDGVVEMMLDATQRHERELTRERLFAWHTSLFPSGRSGMKPLTVGAWRTDSDGRMQVVSGAVGRERVHFEAPEATVVEAEMLSFLDWFEKDSGVDPVLKAGIAHLRFVTIHPFEDGNGRIARALADLLLSRSEQSAERFYSMSAQIRLERNAYYDILEATQKGGLDITPWLQWFLGCLDRAFDHAEETLSLVFRKARFWERHAGETFNERQRDMLLRLLEGFTGKLTSGKWARIQKCSTDTALRDINDLLERQILVREPGGGRSTNYALEDQSDYPA